MGLSCYHLEPGKKYTVTAVFDFTWEVTTSETRRRPAQSGRSGLFARIRSSCDPTNRITRRCRQTALRAAAERQSLAGLTRMLMFVFELAPVEEIEPWKRNRWADPQLALALMVPTASK